MFAILFCFFPFLFMFWNMRLLKKRTSLTYEIKKGQVCFNCKTDLGLDNNDKVKRIMDQHDYFRLCTSCNRDRKINSLNSKFFLYKYNFQKYLASKKSDKLVWYFTIPVLLFIFLDILFKVTHIETNGIFTWVYATLNIIYWSIVTYKQYYTSIKKPSKI